MITNIEKVLSAFVIGIIPYLAFSQAVCGAEIEKLHYTTADAQELTVRINVLRENFSKDFIYFDWGDGNIDTIVKGATIIGGIGYVVDFYGASHVYTEGTNGYMILRLVEEDLVGGLTNIDYTEDTRFVLEDSVLIFSEDASPIIGYSENIGPISSGTNVSYYEGGVLTRSLGLGQFPPDIDSLSPRIANFPVAGYQVPAPPTELYTAPYAFIWDRPTQPGKYALAVKTQEIRYANNPAYDDRVLVSTITKAFIAIVDSNFVVSTVTPTEFLPNSKIYPNPATTTTTLEYAGLNGEIHLKAINAQGQVMLSKTLNGTAQIQREVIDVSTWPAGIYFLELAGEEGRVVRKLVVE